MPTISGRCAANIIGVEESDAGRLRRQAGRGQASCGRSRQAEGKPEVRNAGTTGGYGMKNHLAEHAETRSRRMQQDESANVGYPP